MKNSVKNIDSKGERGFTDIRSNNNDNLLLPSQGINEKILKGEDLFERNIKYKKVVIDGSFPEYIRNNKEMFKNWII